MMQRLSSEIRSLIIQLALGIFSLVVAYICFAILSSNAVGEIGGWKFGGAIAGFLGTWYLSNKFYINSLNKSIEIENKSSTVKELTSRESYIVSVINAVSDAKKTVYLYVHSLDPSNKNENIKTLQDVLELTVKNGKDVKILSPTGQERVEAAYEISQLKLIPIKFLTFLNDEDLRYTLIDDDVSIISINDEVTSRKTSYGLKIKSNRLNKLLKSYFNDDWNRVESWDYIEFIKNTISQLRDPKNPISNTKISEILKVPKEHIQDILEKNNYPKFFFFIGRPASGKTHLIKILISKTSSTKKIHYFNDYAKLYNLFNNDNENKYFEKSEHNGFRVIDFSILNNVLKEANEFILNNLQTYNYFFIEFSRRNYSDALKLFDKNIIQNSKIFYLDSSLDNCLKRNKNRTYHDGEYSEGYVPETILLDYYKIDDYRELKNNYKERVIIIQNNEDDDIPKLVEQINIQLK